MNANEINMVIEKICEKLGMGIESVQQLVPQLVRYKVGVNAFGLACGLILLAVGIWCISVPFRCDNPKSRWHRVYTSDCEPFFFAAGFFALLVGIILASCFSTQLIGWLCAPDIQAIQYIMSMVG